MQTIGPYEIVDTLGVTGRYLIYRAKASEKGQKFLIKTLRPIEIERGDHAQLQHEAGLLQHLGSHEGHFPTVIGWVEKNNPANLVLKDEGFVFLNQTLTKKPLDLDIFFPLAIALAKMLTEIHDAGLIFKNINPQSIWVRPTDNAVQIADFSIATELNRTMVPGDPPRLLQGSLEYIAPEQTGRMNRPLTQAADLYSLGILFYEYLSGSVPFSGIEPMTIIFGHMATLPKDLKECDSTLPHSLCAIVMKLLSKMAEDRYKSALGLTLDLERSYQDWQRNKNPYEVFPLGQYDIATRLELPSKLYGRETETQILFNAFDNLCQTKKNILITVSGYAGVGKTSLIRELIPKIALNKGFLATGKFDKFQRSDTYEGLRQALDKLIRYQLSLPENEYEQFKNTVLAKMGGILKVVTDFVPRLKIIVGEPETLPEVSIEATKNRFELAILRFVKLIALEHPLILLLDDIQWANASLFDLLRKLALSADIQNMLIILSYRNNEVNAEHPLNAFLKAIEEVQRVEKVVVEGLSKESLRQLLQNMLYLPATELNFLTELMEQKTEGNPFFLLMLLEELYRDESLWFSLEKKRWIWNEKHITQISLTDNVLDFVARRIAKLTSDTKEFLHLASCMGSSFNLGDLALAQKEPLSFVARSLHTALQESLIIPTQLKDEWSEGVSDEELSAREYRFQHDKIQQSCYELKPPEETNRIHLELARRWAASYQETDPGTRVMKIANQFNKGLVYVTDPLERKQIAEFNFKAAEVALASSAYDIAYDYSRMAKDLLPQTAWDTDYDFCYQVYFSCIQTAFLSRHFEEATLTTEESLDKAKTTLDKVKLLKLKGDLNRATGAPEGGSAFFERGLLLLGYAKLTKVPNKLDLIYTLLRFKWVLKNHLTPLENLPTTDLQNLNIGYALSQHLAEEAYYAGNTLRYAYIMMTWSLETFKKQPQSLRAIYYIINAILFPRSTFAHTLYQEAAAILQGSSISEESSAFYFAGTVLHLSWHQPWFELVYNFNQGARVCEKIGNLELFALSMLYKIIYDTTLPVPMLLKNLTDLRDHIQDTSQRVVILLDVIHRYYLNLNNGCAFNNWQDNAFDTERALYFFQQHGYQLGIYVFYIVKLQSTIQLNDSASLSTDAKNLEAVLSLILEGNAAKTKLPAAFYLFVAKSILYPSLSGLEKIKTRIQLFRLHRIVKGWVKFCPQNFSHCEVLMRAELAKLKGDLTKASKLYDETIALATEHRVPEYACLAAQRALKLYTNTKQPELTYQYANKAVSLYADWGALGVVKMLQEKYASYLSPESKALSAQKELSKEDYNARYGLDARSIILATRAIHKEMQLGALLHNVMQLLIETIAATRGALCFILKGEFWLEAYYDSEQKEIQTLTHTPWEQARISHEVFLQTWREKKEVLVMDVSKSEEFQGSTYLQDSGAKSLISVPIFNGDGDDVMGVIYCENKLSTDSFTADRLMVLRALSMQMSISIDNSRLYTLFERFVPKPFLNQLGQENIFDLEAGDSVKKDMAVLFMDIRNFTGFSEKHNSDNAFRFINAYLAEVTPVIHAHHGFIDKFLGDGIMALFPGGSRDALHACTIMQQKIVDFANSKPDMHLEVGMGLHYGPLMLGIVGEAEHIEGTVIGDTVNVASRLEALNKMFHTQCLLSDTVKNTLMTSDHYHFRPVGKIRLLGREEAITVWQLLDSIKDPAVYALHIQQLALFERYYQTYVQRDFKAAHEGFAALLKDNPQDGVLAFYTQTSRTYAQTPPAATWQAEIEMLFK